MKAIIPAAGRGTRLLPMTKVMPKELLPVAGKPAIQWVLEEAVTAGFREFVVVISPGKKILRDYLSPSADDAARSDHRAWRDLEELLRKIDIVFVEQPEPRGLGDAVLRCRPFIGDRPFALLLPDTVAPPGTRLLERLLDIHERYGASCLPLQRTGGFASQYGAFIAEPLDGLIYKVTRVVSKGAPESRSLELRGIGRYILEETVFDYLLKASHTGELDDVPALDGLAREGRLLGLLVNENVYHLGANLDQRGIDMDAIESWKDSWKFDTPGHAMLWSLHQELRREIKDRWNRGVPFADELFDRWERAAFLGFGPGASIYNSSLVLGDVQVGEGTWIGPFTVLDGRGGLLIGRYCSIAAGVQLYSHDTLKWALTAGKAPEERAPTKIGDCCYIGPMSIVAKGVGIGEHSVIGANSLVSEEVPAFSIAVGNPARVIGRVEMIGDTDARLVYNEK